MTGPVRDFHYPTIEWLMGFKSDLSRHTPCYREPGVPFAFKDLMIRIILQFTLRIAFRCVLHRRENQEIHRTEDNGIG